MVYRRRLPLPRLAGDRQRIIGVGAFLTITYVFPIFIQSIFLVFDCTVSRNGELTFDADPTLGCPNQITWLGLACLFIFSLSFFIPVYKNVFAKVFMIQPKLRVPDDVLNQCDGTDLCMHSADFISPKGRSSGLIYRMDFTTLGHSFDQPSTSTSGMKKNPHLHFFAHSTWAIL